jgi:hypothetical protein
VTFVLPTDSKRGTEPWLVWDNRPALNSQNLAGLHALVCGVGDYPNLPRRADPLTDRGLGMRRLSSTALTAYLMLDWLLRMEQSGQLQWPLATCRVLLTPSSADELAKAPPLGRPTINAIRGTSS